MAFEFAGFVTRNPVYYLKNWRSTSLVRGAMLRYRDEHPACEYCGRDNIQVHHIEPVSIAPDKAHLSSNLCSLCKKCHLTVGHNGNWGLRYESNLADIIATSKVIKIKK